MMESFLKALENGYQRQSGQRAVGLGRPCWCQIRPGRPRLRRWGRESSELVDSAAGLADPVLKVQHTDRRLRPVMLDVILGEPRTSSGINRLSLGPEREWRFGK